MPVYCLDGLVPVVDPGAFVHPLAALIGDVIVAAHCYIGPGASLRGDFGSIRVGAGANIQDNCVLHTFPGQEVVLEENAHIGHGAVLHGCRIGSGALIGINTIVMDDAAIGADALVGAGSFVRAGFVVPPRMLALGSPARLVRELTGAEIEWKSTGTRAYQALAERCLGTLKECEPRRCGEPGRRGPQAAALAPLHTLGRDPR